MFISVVVLVILTLVLDAVCTMRLKAKYPDEYQRFGSPVPLIGGLSKVRFVWWVLGFGYWSTLRPSDRLVFAAYQVTFASSFLLIAFILMT